MSPRSSRLAARLCLSVLTLSTLLGGGLLARAAAPIVVEPGAMQGWEFATVGSDPSTTSTLVRGPDAPPLGLGSLKMTAKPGEKSIAQTPAYNGVAVADLTVAYSTYTAETDAPLTAALNMLIDTTGEGQSDETLVFEPYEQHIITPGAQDVAGRTWQQWSATEGKWWIFNATLPGYGPGGPHFTLAEYAALRPGAALASVSAAAFRIQVGSSGTGWPAADRFVDQIQVRADTFDFEASATVPTPVRSGAMNGWEFAREGSDPATAASFAWGPGTAPAGVGSLKMTAKPGEKQIVQTRAYNGVPVYGLIVAYSTFTAQPAPSAVTASLNMSIDTNADGLSDETLVFEPYEQQSVAPGSPSVQTGVWQRWQATAGKWWIYNSTVSGFGPSGPRYTLTEYAAFRPGATLAQLSAAAFRIQVGASGSGWPAADRFIDHVELGAAAFDFEPLALVDCDTSTTDIADVQAAVDGAPDGATIRLKGLCDFSAAAPHGGDLTSIASAAVVIRPGTGINGLTITSDGASQSATIQGSGTQTAFLITSGNDDVTITGLRFRELARPIVAIDTLNSRIGAGNQLPPLHPSGTNTSGNDIQGGASMNSAILAVARPASVLNVTYGVGGQSPAALPLSGTLTGLQVRGNAIVYSPPGAPDGDARDVVAIDVRQRGGEASGILIRNNAIDFVSSNFPSFNMNSIRVFAHTNDTAYHVDDVEISNNEMGIGAQELHSAGRAAIVVRAVEDVLIFANGMRANISSTSVPMPGGGIVVSDSTGRITGNFVRLFGDPSTVGTDLGAIGVIDNINRLFASTNDGPPTSDVLVEDNILRAATHRGVVLNGVSDAVVSGNNIATEDEVGISIGEVATGPGSGSNPGPQTLQGAVTGTVACSNVFRDERETTPTEVTDDAAEVRVIATGGTVANAVPGGSAPNLACVPTVALSTSQIGPDADLEATGTGWSTRALTLTLSDGVNTITRALTTDSAGAFGSTFTAADLTALADGTLSATATASEASVTPVLTSASSVVTTVKDTGAPSLAITASTDPISAAQATSATASGITESGATVTVTVSDGSTTTSAMPATVTGGNWTAGPIDVSALTDGAVVFTATATDSAGNLATATRDAVKDVVSPSATVDLVDGDGKVNATETGSVQMAWSVADSGPSVTVALSNIGSAAPASCVFAGMARGPATQTVGASCFSVLADGPILIRVSGQDGAGNPAVATDTSSLDRLVVRPVIASPAENAATRSPGVAIEGLAETGASVEVFEGAVSLGVTNAPNGSWSLVGVTFAEGSHTVTAIATDPAGNVSPASLPRTFSVDTIAPAVAAILSPAEAATEGSTVVVLSGTSEPGSVVRVLEGAALRASITTDNSGSWTGSASFARGPRQITATAVDRAGNTGPVSALRNFTVSSPAPAAPVITTPSQGAVVGSSEVGVGGTGEPGTRVRVFEGPTLVGETPVAADARWSLPAVFPSGAHAITAVGVDGGNEGPASAARSFTVDLGASGRPVILTPDPGTTVGSPVLISGTAAANAPLHLFEGSTRIASTTTSATGSWAVRPALASGPHSVRAALGATLDPNTLVSGVRSFSVDATPPTVAITTSGSTFLPGGSAKMDGTAADGTAVSSIALRYTDVASERMVRGVFAACAGCGTSGEVTWSDTPTLLPGLYRVDAVAVDVFGNVSTAAHKAFTWLQVV